MNSVERLVEVGYDVVNHYRECGCDWLGLSIAVIQGRSPIRVADLPVEEPGGPRLLLEAALRQLPALERRALAKKHKHDLARITPDYLDRVGSILIVQRLWCSSSWSVATKSETWQGLLADVCTESPAWGMLAKNVLDLANSVATEINALIGKPYPLGHLPKQFQQKLLRIESLLSKLSIYSKSNVWAGVATVAGSVEDCDGPSAGPQPAKQPAGSDERQRKGHRTGAAAGGAPRKYTNPKMNKALSAWEKDRQRSCLTDRRSTQWSDWLREYCIGIGVDINDALPERFGGEPWDVRADRFKEALKRRRARERRGSPRGRRTATNSDTNRTVPLPAGAGASWHSVSRGQQTPSLLP